MNDEQTRLEGDLNRWEGDIKASDKLVWCKRIWTRDAEDIRGGPMSSMLGHIHVDEAEKWVKAELILRDCNDEISFQHWVEGKERHVIKARKNLHKIRDMLDQYIEEFEKVCEDIDLE